MRTKAPHEARGDDSTGAPIAQLGRAPQILVKKIRRLYLRFSFLFSIGLYKALRPRGAFAFTATIDTNIFIFDEQRAGRMFRALWRAPVDVKCVSVSDRELRGGNPLKDKFSLSETMIWGESPWGRTTWGGTTEGAYEFALKVISNGSFPGNGERNDLSQKQRNQLKDAIIFATHVRERRDILVSNDRKAFINEGRREQFQAAYKIRIMDYEEFLAFLEQQRR